MKGKGNFHKKRHKFLHECLGELVADFISHTKELPSETTVMRLMEWSNAQFGGVALEKNNQGGKP